MTTACYTVHKLCTKQVCKVFSATILHFNAGLYCTATLKLAGKREYTMSRERVRGAKRLIELDIAAHLPRQCSILRYQEAHAAYAASN